MSTSYFHIVKVLLWTDLKAYKQVVVDKFIDLFIWILAMTVVSSYLLPYFGISKSFGPFTLVGLCVSAGLFEAYTAITMIVDDIEGERIIDYYATLPIPSWLIFVRQMIYLSLTFSLLGIFVIPIGNFFLSTPINLSEVDYPRFFLIFTLMNLFYGAFSLVTASRIKGMLQIGTVWMRFVFPLWYLGCFDFTWKILYSLSPLLAYLDLVNPMVYAEEGMRSAVLGGDEYLNFWFCCGMLVFFTLLSAWVGVRRMVKRLDYI